MPKYDTTTLKEIMEEELKHKWKLDIKYDWKNGWEGDVLGDRRVIMLYLSPETKPLGPFLHELAHAIDIEERGDRAGKNPHDVHYRDIVDRLVMKYQNWCRIEKICEQYKFYKDKKDSIEKEIDNILKNYNEYEDEYWDIMTVKQKSRELERYEVLHWVLEQMGKECLR